MAYEKKIQEFESWQKISCRFHKHYYSIYRYGSNGGTEYPEYVRENREPVLRAVCNVESSLKIIADMQVINRNILIMATTDGVDSNNANLEKTRELIEQNQKELENLASGYVSGQDK